MQCRQTPDTFRGSAAIAWFVVTGSNPSWGGGDVYASLCAAGSSSQIIPLAVLELCSLQPHADLQLGQSCICPG